MSDDELDAAVTALRRYLDSVAVEPVSRTPECLTYRRVEAAVLDPVHLREAERHHLEGCSRCQRLVALMERKMTHPPLPLLLRWRSGGLSGAIGRLMDDHLESGGCRRCQERTNGLERSLGFLIAFDPQLPLRSTSAALAAGDPTPVPVRSPNAVLQAELYEEGGRVTLEVLTRDQSLNRRLLGYWLSGHGGASISGFAVLRPDVDGWYSAQARFASEELGPLGTAVQEAVVCLVENEVLTGEEREALLESVRRDVADSELRQAWQEWWGQVRPHRERLPAEAWLLLAEVGQLL